MSEHSLILKKTVAVAQPRLSICIATYNRAQFIQETLDSIVGQLGAEVELIVVEGASPDGTHEVMARYQSVHPQIRYYREAQNSGIDGDYDKAVTYARGEYCWLMTDDDLLRPGAVARVLAATHSGVDIVVVNSEIRSADFSTSLEVQSLKLTSDASYGLEDGEKFFADTTAYLSFIGGVVVRRSLWMRRDRARYYGTLFIHVGVIFQRPLENGAYVIAEPLIVIRYGNAMWTARGFDIWMFRWPDLIWSFAEFSEQARSRICPREPWRQLKNLVLQRGIGGYGAEEYRRHIAAKARGWTSAMSWLIAMSPARLINLGASLYCIFLNQNARSGLYDLSRSCHATWIGRYLAHHLRNIR